MKELTVALSSSPATDEKLTVALSSWTTVIVGELRHEMERFRDVLRQELKEFARSKGWGQFFVDGVDREKTGGRRSSPTAATELTTARRRSSFAPPPITIANATAVAEAFTIFAATTITPTTEVKELTEASFSSSTASSIVTVIHRATTNSTKLEPPTVDEKELPVAPSPPIAAKEEHTIAPSSSPADDAELTVAPSSPRPVSSCEEPQPRRRRHVHRGSRATIKWQL
ncbi:unnamed protein product [Linum trigynum]|uniref:Uncharacterized protein n=1 Tax=Linum trigynum TaxID=586398 RepID=A0AAV2EVG7_9ROSI